MLNMLQGDEQVLEQQSFSKPPKAANINVEVGICRCYLGLLGQDGVMALFKQVPCVSSASRHRLSIGLHRLQHLHFQLPLELPPIEGWSS